MTKRDLNISNILSFLRLILAIPFFIFLINREDFIAVLIGIIAVVTDFIDGWLARKLDISTDLGRMLDPLGDKILLAAAVIALLIRGDIPIWFFVIVFTRDILILLGGLYLKKKSGNITESNIWGKIAFAFTAVVILGIIADISYFFDYGFYISALFLIISFISYIVKFIKYLQRF